MSTPGSPSSSNKTETQQILTQIITTLRKQKRDLADTYQSANRILMRSFELSTKEEIIRYAQNEFEIRQKKELLDKLVRDTTYLSQNFSDFYRNYEKSPYIDKYLFLISASSLFGIQNINNFSSKLPLQNQPEPITLKTFGSEKEAGLYVRKFAEEKGSSQGADERLFELFRCVKPQPKQSSKKESSE